MEMQDFIWQILLLVASGAAAGFLGSLLGIGGGMLVTPIITICLGIDIKYSIGACAVVVIATSAGSTIAYLKDNILNLKVAMFLEIFTTLGALVGALIVGIIAPFALYLIFASFMLFSAVNMLRKIFVPESKNLAEESSPLARRLQLNSSYFDVKAGKEIAYNVVRVPLGSAIMLFAGVMSGMLGVGAGVFKVIAMDNVMKMPLKPSTSTSNLMMGVTAVASALVYFANGQILPQIAAPLVIGVLVGSVLGTRVMPKVNPKVIRGIYIPILLLICASMTAKAFGVVLF